MKGRSAVTVVCSVRLPGTRAFEAAQSNAQGTHLPKNDGVVTAPTIKFSDVEELILSDDHHPPQGASSQEHR
jgi:hypothetical protein